MSARNAAAAGPVATLAQGLRDLRDNAEGPDGVELELLTSLAPDTIAEALRGVELPTLAVTVALVDAWGGDVEAWALYWAQINEIAVRAQPLGSDTPDGTGDATGTDDAPDTPAVESGQRAPEVTAAAPAETTQPKRPVQATGAAADAPAAKSAAAAADPWQAPRPAPSSGADEAIADKTAASSDAETKVVPKPALVAAAAAAPADQGKPNEPAKPGQPATSQKSPKPAKTSEPKSHRGLIIVGTVVVIAGVGGFLAYSAVHHDDKKSVATSTTPTPSTSHPSASHAASPTASSAPVSTVPSVPTAASGPATSAPTTATTTGAAYPPGYEIGAYTSVQLPSGYSLDFLTDPSHPSFGTDADGNSLGLQATSSPGSAVSPTDSFDTGVTGGTAGSVSGRFLAGQAVVFDAEEAGTFERCLNDTRYQADVDLAQLSIGAQFCVHTTGGRLVLVRVDRMPQPSDANPYAVLDVTIWQG